jgi:hypothetical protein
MEFRALAPQHGQPALDLPMEGSQPGGLPA